MAVSNKFKKGFYSYRKLTRKERRAFRTAFKLERKEMVKDRSKMGLKSEDGLIHYLRDDYMRPADFVLFAFAWSVSPLGGQYWNVLHKQLQQKYGKHTETVII